MSSAVSGLDQLCAAACAGCPGSPSAAIKVIEVEAYGSVADLIHAAIAAHDGAADLKAIYEVCELHGRIAYRRADGSRLITQNEHWKSQVRHALYTGGKFQRVPSNSELWQLSHAHRGSVPELVKVLVRVDDNTANVRATLSPRTARADSVQPSTTRGRRKRGGVGQTSAEATAMCDSVEAAASKAVAARQRTVNTRRRATPEEGPPDDHSTLLDEAAHEVEDLPRLRGRRTTRHSDPLEAPPQASRRAKATDLSEGQRSSAEHFGYPASQGAFDPSTLRWGSTGMRSTIILQPDRSRSDGLIGQGQNRHVCAAEADSGRGHGKHATGGAAIKKRRVVPSERTAVAQPESVVPTPKGAGDAAAIATPPAANIMMQWTQALQQMHEAAVAAQMSVASGLTASTATFPPTIGPMATALPSYLPALLAAAAPLMAGNTPQQLEEKMQAALAVTAAAVTGEQSRGAPSSMEPS
jgi:hypothetical protein